MDGFELHWKSLSSKTLVTSLPVRTRKIAVFEGITAGTLFGTAAIFIRILNQGGVDAFSIALFRLVIATVFLAAVLLIPRKPLITDVLRRSWQQILFLGFLVGMHFILFVSAVVDTSILNATVLVNTTPIWSMFLSSFVFKIKPSRLAVVGILIAFFGVGVLTYEDASSGVWTISLKGDIEATLAAVVEAFYLNYGRETRQKTPVVNLMITIYIFAVITVLASGVAVRSVFSFSLQPVLLLALVGLGLLPTALAHTLYFSSLSHLKSFETATMAFLEPIVATLLGIVILTQVPGELFVVGAAIVLGGLTLVILRE